MITAAIGYIAAAAFAAGLLVGGYVAWEWLGAHEYRKGFAAGMAEEMARSRATRDKLEFQLKAEALEVMNKEAARVREIERIRHAALEASRAQFHADKDAAGAELQRVLGRLRAAESTRGALGDSSGGRRVSTPGAAAGRVDGPAASGLLPAADRAAAIATLAAQADEVAGKYRVCLALFPAKD